jgi:glucokinase
VTPDVPVLEVGGTHVGAALVRTTDWSVVFSARQHLDSHGTVAQILDSFVAAGATLPVSQPATWGIAMPDPFDYAHGVASFRDVGKFDDLYGVDVGAALRASLPGPPTATAFVNDADAFILGEWTRGAATGFSRCVGITLGTGLGSGWLVDGAITASGPGVPELGRARHLVVDGAGLEEIMSRRALRRAYAAGTGDTHADVLEITRRARDGEVTASSVLRHGFHGLGRAMGPAMREFQADVIVVGGSMSASWDLYEPWFREGMDWPDHPPIRLPRDPEHAAMIGAARFTTFPPAR